MTQQRRVPLSVIGGFLGAGKTSLLNRWLHNAQGQRIAALVNDFGSINIDAELIASTLGSTIALTNGCVCCQIGDDLSVALINILEAPEPFDAVVIEASGVSDPWRIAQMGMADPGLSLEGVIVVVDASAVLEQASNTLLFDTFERQLKAADLIVVNKTDLVEDSALMQIEQWINLVAGPTPQFKTSQAKVPQALLSGHALQIQHDHPHGEQCNSLLHGANHLPHDHGEVFETWCYRADGLFSSERLLSLLRSMPEGVLRSKGWVYTDTLGWADFQFAGRRGSLRSVLAPRSGTAIVSIGLRDHLPIEALRVALERCYV
jgi:G3E family GTPase